MYVVAGRRQHPQIIVRRHKLFKAAAMDDHQLRRPDLRRDIRPFKVRQFNDDREVRPIATRFSGRGIRRVASHPNSGRPWEISGAA